jgi:perosamine synthetase
MKKFIPISRPSITQKEIAYVTDAVSSGWVSSLGPYIEKFEDMFARYCGTRFAVSVSNATNGLHLALEALGVSEGDEVIIPDFTFIATANAVAYTGAIPIFVDVDPISLCIEPTRIEAAITRNTKVIMPVHIYGHASSMDEINRIAQKHNLFVIEDAAEAHGAEINNIKVGSLGTCGVFSFYGNKIITSGEGGMITTNDEQLYKKLLYLRDHAMSKEKKYWHTEIGYNYRMTNIQAALGVAQMERIDSFIEKKREIFGWYNEELGNLKRFVLNQSLPSVKNVFWMICVQILNISETERDACMVTLKEFGIDSRPFFYPMSDMPMYNFADTPVTHRISKIGLNLPSYYDLTKNEVIYICDSLKKILHNYVD